MSHAIASLGLVAFGVIIYGVIRYFQQERVTEDDLTLDNIIPIRNDVDIEDLVVTKPVEQPPF